MTTQTVITCDSADGCANVRPTAETERDGWSHFQVDTLGKFGVGVNGGKLDVDLCPVHAIVVRSMFGPPA